MSNDERFDKLPKWARDKIGVLEMRNAELTKRLSDYESQATEATSIRLLGYGQPDIALPDHSTARFKIGPNYEEYIDVGFKYDNMRPSRGKVVGLYVRASNRIYIEPQTSNAFLAKCEMRADRIPKQDAST
jgi:hypothetical protein